MNTETKPKDYPAKQVWQSADSAAAYRLSREPSRFERYHREQAIIDGWLGELAAGALVLDIPCGTGRLIEPVTRRALRYIGADFSRAMIREAQQSAGDRARLGFVNADAAHLPFRDDSVDCVIIWRLLHHIKDAPTRLAMLREAGRVARHSVLISYHHPISFTAARRWVQRKLFGRTQGGGEITQWRLRREARECGLELVDSKGFRKYISVNWFARLRKRSSSP
jgi:ubiquinone/menaquinone biosynthesis C-methylase UbiE